MSEAPSDRKPGEQCDNCRFFADMPLMGQPGTCTKRPRLFQKDDEGTYPDLWCQYYERKAMTKDKEVVDPILLTEKDKPEEVEEAVEVQKTPPFNDGVFLEVSNFLDMLEQSRQFYRNKIADIVEGKHQDTNPMVLAELKGVLIGVNGVIESVKLRHQELSEQRIRAKAH